jgi:signal transduction histidine kinase
MARKCFMCGGDVAGGGILCPKCDKPRKTRAEALALESVAAGAPAGRRALVNSPGPASALLEAPVARTPSGAFALESVSITNSTIISILNASGAASVFLGADKRVRFVSEEAKKLFDASKTALTLKSIETQTGLVIGNVTTAVSAGLRLRNRNLLYSLVPIIGGSGGAVLIFRYAEPMSESDASFVTYLRETVFGPLKQLRDTLQTAARRGASESLLTDSAATVEHVLASLELAPGIDEAPPSMEESPTVTEVVQRVAGKYTPFTELKGVQLQVDAQDLNERLSESDRLADSLGILMENAIHYAPAGGQVVIGVRSMEHKGKPLLLFFVMDNGPLVPEELRQSIFEESFVWNASAEHRTGRRLSVARQFAAQHSGSVWVESKTGKACTFFLRIRPDGVA